MVLKKTRLGQFNRILASRSIRITGVALSVALLTGISSIRYAASTLANPTVSTDEQQTGSSSGTLVSAEADSTASSQLVSAFADQVIVATYEELVARSAGLVESMNAFVSDPSEQTLQAAQEAWAATRFPWEQSEAFAFGPAESLGYDGDLDDWPVNESDVMAVINGGDELTSDYIATLQTTQKGFHAIEFILFGTDNDKTVEDFSERELAYLQAATIAFDQTANNLLQSWVEGVDGNPAYREVLATAGSSDNPAYLTANAGVEEILQGMLGCLDEVANVKIGEPLATKDPLDLESRFSQTTLNDLQNNILSVKSAYLGTVSEMESSSAAATQSLSALVSQQDPALDERIKNEIQAAIDALAAIPGPIETNLEDTTAATQMETAKVAILQVFETLETEVLPLVQE